MASKFTGMDGDADKLSSLCSSLVYFCRLICVSSRWLVCFLGALAELRGRFGEFKCPFFILQGTGDKVVDPAGAQMFHNNAASKKKHIKVCTHV